MEAIIRLSASLGIFIVMACWEWYSPRRELSLSRRRRWPVNLGLAGLNMLLLRVSVGAIAYQSALWTDEQQFGLLPIMNAPVWLRVVFTLLFLDLAIYAQHIAAHQWRWFWRLHQVHHTDLDFDASTAVRFHPLEIMLSMAYKVVLILLLGAHPLSVIVFEIILNGCALFNHGNVYIPQHIDRLLRYVMITPDMHRIHHSAWPRETDSNYGFSLSCWDRLFHTYIAVPQQDQRSMTVGLTPFRDAAELGFFALLALPFRRTRQR